jgi:hypothetical protein
MTEQEISAQVIREYFADEIPAEPDENVRYAAHQLADFNCPWCLGSGVLNEYDDYDSWDAVCDCVMDKV